MDSSKGSIGRGACGGAGGRLLQAVPGAGGRVDGLRGANSCCEHDVQAVDRRHALPTCR